MKDVVLGATALMMVGLGYAMYVDLGGLSTKNLAAHRRFWGRFSRSTMADYRRGGIAFMAFGMFVGVLVVWDAIHQ